jgi:hypothetical protein
MVLIAIIAVVVVVLVGVLAVAVIFLVPGLLNVDNAGNAQTSLSSSQLVGTWEPSEKTRAEAEAFFANVVSSQDNEPGITIFLSDDALESDVSAFRDFIRSLPDVKAVAYVSKEEALERFQESMGEGIAEQLDGNPLPASFEVSLRDYEAVERIVSTIMRDSSFPKVVDRPDNPTESIKYDTYEYGVEDLLPTLVFNEDGSVILRVSENMRTFEYREEDDRVIIYDNSGNDEPFVLDKRLEDGKLTLHMAVDPDKIPLLDELVFEKS